MTTQSIEVPIRGMDCHECTQHVQHAIAALPGISRVEVFLTAEKAVVELDPARVTLSSISDAVSKAGYSVPSPDRSARDAGVKPDFIRAVVMLFGLVFFAVLFIVVVGEWLGFFHAVTDLVPLPIGVAIVALFGYPIFRNVIRATLNRQVIAHTLMSVGVLAALVVGEWATAAVVVFFMRVGDYAERFTTERARRAVKDMAALAPQTARIERDGEEIVVPADAVQPGEIVIVRPGEQIPVDGEVISGSATVDQATITGESMPVEAGAGSRVYAATFARLGSLRIRTLHAGRDATFGRVVHLVEEAESHRAEVQRVADRFSAYYLPVVAGVAVLTFAIRRDPLATAAVLVVACSCAFALATPIAMLASVGAGARRGLLIKGGKYLEALAQADVLLIDKTGTLTLGKPQLTDLVAEKTDEAALLGAAASAERYSEHPLAGAVRDAARQRAIALTEAHEFSAEPGVGVSAVIGGVRIRVGSRRSLAESLSATLSAAADRLEADGKTVLVVLRDGEAIGLMAAADTLRAETPLALRQCEALGIRRIELLTGDNERAASALASQLGIAYQANLMPQDKIEIVKRYQREGHVVVMVGDGVNDAPALAQANVGIAMGTAGTGIAIEAAHVVLMRDDWSLVPDVLRIARRTMSTVRLNIIFTLAYNAVGLTLAAIGLLPPIFAAAAQSLPDLGILANSSRLIRQR